MNFTAKRGNGALSLRGTIKVKKSAHACSRETTLTTGATSLTPYSGEIHPWLTVGSRPGSNNSANSGVRIPLLCGPLIRVQRFQAAAVR